MSDESPSEPEIDLYSLHLLRQVAKFRGFTAASEACGLSQSALTRQVQAIEARLGIKVFDRTTRAVTITEPGAVLLRETEAIPHILRGAMRRIREDYQGDRREIRIGISHDLGQAHVLGIFHPQRKLQPDVGIVVSQHHEEGLQREVGSSALDLGILTCPRLIPTTVEVTHRMVDRFILVVSAGTMVPSAFKSAIAFRKWANAQRWLLPPGNSRSREIIDDWAMGLKVDLQPVMELDGFDLMLEFAAMGMGATLIPRRCLGPFRRKRQIKVVPTPVGFGRQLIVIAPKHSKCPEHVTRFVEGILFS